MSADVALLIAAASVALGGGVLIWAMYKATPPKPSSILGECPTCKAVLTKENTPEIPCMDAKFYCTQCLRTGQCGCHV